ncbi:MAG: ABC transporter permease [Candidatus Riflebacteria bacterium]|nr:ABC transporter permease [Candidatus Riflebacteria bacterium]
MITLLLKEMRELFWHFLLLVLFGLASMCFLAWFKALDSGALSILLFGFSCPIFIMIYSSQMVSGEVMRGTFPFLATLPLSRHRIWLIKAVSCLFFAIGLSLVYGLMIWSISPEMVVLRSYTQWIPQVTGLSLLLGLPVLLAAIGMFATMMPASTIVTFLIVAALFGSMLLIPYVNQALNYSIALPLFIAIFFTSSRQAFIKGELMDSWRPCFWGVGTLIIAGLLALGLWMCLDLAADHDFVPTGLRIHDLGTLGNSTLPILSGNAPSAWYDPIRDSYIIRTFMIDPQTGATRQIGPRGCAPVVVSPDNRYLAAYALRRRAGLVTGSNLLIIDLAKTGGSTPNSAESHSKSGFNDNGMVVIEEDDTNPIAFIDRDRLLYRRTAGLSPSLRFSEFCFAEVGSYMYKSQQAANGSRISELCIAEIGSGTRVLDSFESLATKMEYLPAAGWVLVSDCKTVVLVNPQTGERHHLPTAVAFNAWPIGQIASMSLIQCERHLTGSQTEIVSYGVTSDGALATLSWLAPGTVWIGDEPKPLALVKEIPAPGIIPSSRTLFNIVRLDPQTHASETLTAFLASEYIYVCPPVPGSRYLMLQCAGFVNFGGSQTGTLRFDPQTSQKDMLPSPVHSFISLRAIDRDRYLARGSDDEKSLVWILDATTGKYRQILESQKSFY